MLLALIPIAINAIYATMASGYYHTGAPEKLERVLQLSTRWCLILGLPVVLLFVLGAREILSLWGSEFANEYPTLAVLAIAQLFNIPSGILAYTLVMCNRPGLELINTLTLLGLVILTNMMLIPVLGLIGAAVSLLLVNTFGMLLRWWQVQERIKVMPFNGAVVKPFISVFFAGVAGLGAVLWLRSAFDVMPFTLLHTLATVLVLVAVVGVVYVAGIIMLGFEAEDRVFTAMIRANLQKLGGTRNAA
jgi:O-antigen/teichoic acid export membrane protein